MGGRKTRIRKPKAMRTGAKRAFLFAFQGVGILTLCMVCLPIVFSSWHILPYALAQQKVRSLATELMTEKECPVSVDPARGELDLDDFGAPIAVSHAYFAAAQPGGKSNPAVAPSDNTPTQDH